MIGVVIPMGYAPRCIFVMVHVAYFINISNRLLTCGIVVYRYVFVLRSSWVQTPSQRWSFSSVILSSILVTSLSLTVWSLSFKELNLHVLGWVTMSISCNRNVSFSWKGRSS